MLFFLLCQNIKSYDNYANYAEWDPCLYIELEVSLTHLQPRRKKLACSKELRAL